MPALGNRGQVAPRDIKRAEKAPVKITLPRGSVPQALPRTSTMRQGQKQASPRGLKAETRNARFTAKPHPVREALKEGGSPQALKAPKAKGGAGGGVLASILNVLPAAEAKGYANIFGTSGVTGKIGKFAGNAASDVAQLGEAPFVGGLMGGKAVAAGTKGNWTPAKEFGSSIVQGLEHGAPGELLQGHLKGAAKAAFEHPGFTVAEGAGVAGVAGRSGGALARAAGSQAEKEGTRGALARAGSTVRPPIALTEDSGLAKRGTNLKQREYSKDAVRKRAQVQADKHREPLLDAKGKAVTVVERGRTVPVLRPKGREQERFQSQRASFEAGRNQSVEVLEREKQRKTANSIEGRVPKVLPAQRLGQELSQLVASGTIRSANTFKGDLAKRIRTIQDALTHPERYRTRGTQASPGELKATRHNLELLQKALRNPRVLAAAPAIVKNGLKYAEALSKGDVRLEGLHVHPKEELERAALSEYALAHMKARHAEVNGEAALRNPKGELLTNEMIRRHAVSSGRHPDTLAYIPHVIGAGRRSSFHQPFRPNSRPVFAGQTRTGALYRRGATAIGHELTREEMTKKAVTASNAESIDKFLSETGARDVKGRYFTGPQGIEAAARLNADGTSQYTPVRAFAAKLSKETQEQLREHQNPSSLETAHRAMLNDRIVASAGSDKRTRNVVLVPKHQLDTLLQHLNPPGEAEKVAQLLNGPFRMAVLPQPRWLTGNFVEPHIIRLPLSGAGINLPGSAVDFAAFNKVVGGMEKSGDASLVRSANEIRAMQAGGLFIGRKGASIRRTYQDFSGSTARALYAAHVARNLPVMKQMGDLILSIPHTFFALNKVLVETPVQKIAFGKQARMDVQQITGSWLKTIKLGERALDEVQKGLVNTSTQHRFMERQYELLGQYNGFNPTMRKLVQTAFPFLPWTLNSLRFVYWTLPVHHTGAFTALLKASQHVQAEWEAEHKDVPPGTLSDALKRKDKGLVDVGRYTPFGVSIPLAHGQAEGLTNTFMPQLAGAQKALQGQDPFGRALQVPKTKNNPSGEASTGERVGAAVNQGLESLVPLIAMIRRLQEGGGTSYANSTVFSPKAKPESSHGMSALDRTLNPFRPTYVKPPKTKKLKLPGLGSGIGGGLGSSLGSSLK